MVFQREDSLLTRLPVGRTSGYIQVIGAIVVSTLGKEKRNFVRYAAAGATNRESI